MPPKTSHARWNSPQPLYMTPPPPCDTSKGSHCQSRFRRGPTTVGGGGFVDNSTVIDMLVAPPTITNSGPHAIHDDPQHTSVPKLRSAPSPHHQWLQWVTQFPPTTNPSLTYMVKPSNGTDLHRYPTRYRTSHANYVTTFNRYPCSLASYTIMETSLQLYNTQIPPILIQ